LLGVWPDALIGRMYKVILLLIGSNIFMTIAWYGHLKFRWLEGKPLLVAILLAWGVAFFEYCLQVPANRLGYLTNHLSGYQLKVIQEVITLTVFIVFAWVVLKERLTWNYAASFVCMMLAVYFAMAFTIAYWHSFRGVGSDPFGPGTIVRPWEKGKDPVSIAKRGWMRRLNSSRRSRRRSMLPRPRHRARRPDAGRIEPQSRQDGRPRKGAPEGDRREAALGHGEPVFQSPLHVRRGDESRRARFRLRGGAGEEGARSHQGRSAARTTFSGAGARVTRRCSTPT
jgi:uncharacterized protein (DUF486 family)